MQPTYTCWQLLHMARTANETELQCIVDVFLEEKDRYDGLQYFLVYTALQIRQFINGQKKKNNEI